MCSRSCLFQFAMLGLLVSNSGGAQTGRALLETPSRSYRTGDQVLTDAYRPEAMATADFDRDGDTDVVLAHYGNFIAPCFNVLRNDGTGAFGTPETYPISGEMSDVFAADFDGDGDPDVAFTQSSLGTSGQRVCIFKNDGSGAFGPESSYATGNGPWGLVALDADNDGDLDLATANWSWGEADVSVLYNDGNAGFALRADFPVPGVQPTRVFAGDLTGDGWTDLVVTVRGGLPAFFMLRNNGAGAFGPAIAHVGGATTGSELMGAGIGDVDLDGDLDVISGRDQDSGSVGMSVGLFRNLGNGQFSAAQPIPTTGAFAPVWNFAVIDVTNDGWPDILGTGYGTDYGWLLIPSAGAGAFGSPTAFRTGEDARDLDAVDVDGDGDRDVVVVDSSSLTLTVHKNEGGAFSMPPTWLAPGGSGELVTGDIDHDGDIDAVTAASWITTLLNDGSGNFGIETMNASIGIQKRIRLADVSGDGFADAVTLDADTNVPYQFHVLRNSGNGTFGTVRTYLIGSCGPGDIVPIDFDNDLDLDLVITEYLGCAGSAGGIKLFFFRNNGSGLFEALPPFASFAITKGERIEAGDFDGDGNADLVTTHPDTIAYWKGHGDGTFELGVEYALGEWGPKYMKVADFDADGLLDIATSNFGNTFRGECISVVRGIGDGSFGPPAVHYAIFSLALGNPAGIRVGDLDRDGDLDLIAGAYAADDVAVLTNRGDGTFASEARYGVNGKVNGIAVADFDGDRRLDVVASVGFQPPIQSGVTLMRGVGPKTAKRWVSPEIR